MPCALPLLKLLLSYPMATLSNTKAFSRTDLKFSLLSHKRVVSAARFHLQLHPRFKPEHAICALATVESETLAPISGTESQNGAGLNFGASQDEYQEDSDPDEREKLRRSRISRANKGNIPWNKGKKHSPETLQRIRERTKIAMQNPKVKMKLMQYGHAHSEETKSKIGDGVKEGWRRRREAKLIQEECHIEWRNVIAEASRVGLYAEKELHWNSYELLQEELEREWTTERVQRRKAIARERSASRSPHSVEQRKKIAEAIRAKWADPDYRERVRTGMIKYHGLTPGSERKKKPDKTPSSNRKISTRPKLDESEIKSVTVPKEKKKYEPKYKDPMVSTKLEMIKKVKDQRLAREKKKREAAERAKLLIAEAEKAAKALVVAAATNPLAQQALEEARYLIAEATKMLDSIEPGPLPANSSLNSISSPDSGAINQGPTKQHVNGKNTLNLNGSALNLTLDGGETEINGFQILVNGLVGEEEISRVEEEDDREEFRTFYKHDGEMSEGDREGL